jgi:hypothetical protein
LSSDSSDLSVPYHERKEFLAEVAVMIAHATLDRLLTQVNCRIMNISRLRDTGAISQCEAEQQLKQAVEFRAMLMRRIDGQNFAFDA